MSTLKIAVKVCCENFFADHVKHCYSNVIVQDISGTVQACLLQQFYHVLEKSYDGSFEMHSGHLHAPTRMPSEHLRYALHILCLYSMKTMKSSALTKNSNDTVHNINICCSSLPYSQYKGHWKHNLSECSQGQNKNIAAEKCFLKFKFSRQGPAQKLKHHYDNVSIQGKFLSSTDHKIEYDICQWHYIHISYCKKSMQRQQE